MTRTVIIQIIAQLFQIFLSFPHSKTMVQLEIAYDSNIFFRSSAVRVMQSLLYFIDSLMSVFLDPVQEAGDASVDARAA